MAGDNRRPAAVPREQFLREYDRIFSPTPKTTWMQKVADEFNAACEGCGPGRPGKIAIKPEGAGPLDAPEYVTCDVCG